MSHSLSLDSCCAFAFCSSVEPKQPLSNSAVTATRIAPIMVRFIRFLPVKWSGMTSKIANRRKAWR